LFARLTNKETTMILPTDAHVAVADGERFLLMRNRGTAIEPRLEHEATPQVDTSNKSAGVRLHDDRGKKEGKESIDKVAHATGVAEWLNKAVLDQRIEKLAIVADPSTLGEMRNHYSKHLQAALLGEVARELTAAPGPDILRALEAV
jgi:protein required for attachment to host cells